MRRIVTVVLLLTFVGGAAAWRLADVKPDPNAQAIADGCQRDTTKIYTGLAPNWVYVNDKDFPSSGPAPAPRWVDGTVKGPLGLLASRIASSDDPITHHSYDVNLDVTVDSANDFLTGVSRDTTAEQGTLHLERESTSFPEWARPRAGDRIEALGSWIWDCDHYQGRGEKTEFHPFRAAFVVRPVSPRAAQRSTEADVFVSTDATPAGRQAQCAAQNGTYRGDGTSCGLLSCVPETGACCFPDGHCATTTQTLCTGAGGLYRGNGTGCATANCPQPGTGACCVNSPGVRRTKHSEHSLFFTTSVHAHLPQPSAPRWK